MVWCFIIWVSLLLSLLPLSPLKPQWATLSVHACIHKFIVLGGDTHIHTHTHTHTLSMAHAHMHTLCGARTLAHTHTYTHTCMHMHTHTHTYTHTHTDTLTHCGTHTYILCKFISLCPYILLLVVYLTVPGEDFKDAADSYQLYDVRYYSDTLTFRYVVCTQQHFNSFLLCLCLCYLHSESLVVGMKVVENY